MRTIAVLLLLLSALVVTVEVQACTMESVHTYHGIGTPPPKWRSAYVPQSFYFAVVWDSEPSTSNCSGGFDGDFDVGILGGAFGHGPWAQHCKLTQEVRTSITVEDAWWGRNVGFVTGSDDTTSGVPDPVTGENTCITDGIISPGTDSDDCLSALGTGTQTVTCPGGGDGLLWVFLAYGNPGYPPPVGGTITT
ncbi:MAG TPA: hypothetical protein VNX21_05215 [Candidatus Thermoplasmatota archaeon]|nr:hypothetical protein [Candidatus Thermoplasmatota archaeon]